MKRKYASAQGVVPPVENTIEQIKSVLKQSGGSNTLSRIGRKVQKPKSRRLLKVVQARPREFVVRRCGPCLEHHVELVNHKTTDAPALSPPARVVHTEMRKEEVHVMENETKRLKYMSSTVKEIIQSFEEHKVKDLAGLEIICGAMSNYPNPSDQPIFVGLDFRCDTNDRILPTFVDFFVAKSRFTFQCQPSSAQDQDGLRALLYQKQIFFIIRNPEQLFFMTCDKNHQANFNLLDSQLVGEYLFQEPYLEWETILDKLLKKRFRTEQLDAASENNRKHLFFHLLWEEMLQKLRQQDVLFLRTATKNRMLNVQQARYRFGFDSINGYLKHSTTLANMAREDRSPRVRPQDFLDKIPLEEEEEDFRLFLECLPSRLSIYLDKQSPIFEYVQKNITEIVLDLGRRPYLWAGGSTFFFGDTPDSAPVLVEQEDIDEILNKGQFHFGPDNRAMLPGLLHRIAAMRDRMGKTYGLTLRHGRHVKGNAGLILDMLHGSKKSILILGPPGSGKTSLVREIARVLSERMNSCVIVDNCNEIGGDGDEPHPSIGHARRMMVPSLEQQSSVMLECVQNHTPHVMIVDGIGRSNEVVAARTIKNCGVRLVASAHGDLRGLVANSDLNGLIGGVQAVTLGDGLLAIHRASMQALVQSSVEKVVAQRVGPPIFDVIIELDMNNKDVWKVITEPCEAVDAVLNGDHYSYELRFRNTETFEMFMNRYSDG